MLERKPDLKVHIVAPSAYDDNGLLKQYSRILMLTPAFAILDGIIDKAAGDYGLNISIQHHNERLERGEGYLDSIIKDRSASNSIVIFNVKSFELPRAVDAAKRLVKAGIQVALGGPGVTLADRKVYEHLIQDGISFNVGEGENTMRQMMQDAIGHQLKQAYWEKGFVDMREAPLPKFPEQNEFKGILKRFAAIDLSEGCPFGCSFCSVRKIRGSNTPASRCRLVDPSLAYIAEANERGLPIMIIDDNVRMANTYPETKKKLISLNEESSRKGRALYLFGQADVREDIIPEIPDLAAMGFRHLFFGMETLDPSVLEDSKKKQNNPGLYHAIADICHKNRIAVSTGRMVDFPKQTPESIHLETTEFCKIADTINNYLVTALPGTDDYFEAIRKGELTTWDLNQYDGMHAVRSWFETMTIEEATTAFNETFVESFPIKHRDERARGHLYPRFLAELGRRFYGRPFHIMMDGMPHFPLPWGRVQRPKDGFTGFEQDPNDPAFKSSKSNKTEKAKYLSQVAWSPREVVAV